MVCWCYPVYTRRWSATFPNEGRQGDLQVRFILKFDPTNTNQASIASRRIRDNEYEFPTERVISSAAQHLISQILTPIPSQRPTLHEIVDHAFFTLGPVPSYIPTSAHDTPPDFGRISKPISDNNLKRLRKYSLLDMDYSSLPSNSLPSSGSSGGGLASSKSITTSIAQQEKEFQKAVQPGSPISALLSSARQPLLMGTGAGAAGMGAGGANTRESPLLRKLQAVKESPLGRRSVTRGLDGIVEEKENNYKRKGGDDGMEQHEEEEVRLRKKELEAQKARIVAQMAPVREEPEVEETPVPVAPKPRERMRERYGAVDRENVVPPVPRVAAPSSKYGSLRDRAVMDKENTGNFLPFYGIPLSLTLPLSFFSVLGYAPAAPQPAPPIQSKLNGFDAAAQTLTMAFDAKAMGRVFRDPHQGNLPIPDEKVFIVSWVDYCNKYGMGYALTDGSVGVHFNDSTTLVLSPDKVYVYLVIFQSI